MKRINWKIFLSCLVVVYIAAFFGNLLTVQSVSSDWYQSIKPSITPPGWVFPIIWNVIYLFIVVSLYLSWRDSKPKQKKKLALAFGVNLVLGVLWSLFYFWMQNPLLALIDIIPFWISILFMILITKKINKTSAYLLVPYLVWVTFATVLNYLSVF